MIDEDDSDTDEPLRKKSKPLIKTTLEFESDLYSATNYHPILSEESRAVAELDNVKGLDGHLDEKTFFLKTRTLQRHCLDMPIKEQIQKFPWLKNVSIC